MVNTATGAALPGVKVNLQQGGDIWYSSTTDAQGHFLFDHVQDGVYRAVYSTPDYWEDRPTGPPQFRVAAGNPVKLEGRLTPLARISGRVVDGAGKPVAGAHVQLMGPRRATFSITDAAGKFDLHNEIIPDAYRLFASPPAAFPPPDPEPGTGRLLNWTATWFPGVTTMDAATKIDLPPGGHVTDIEIRLMALPAHPVRGVLLDPDGKPSPKVKVDLNGPESHLQAESKSDGAFEFPAVVDGGWRLTAELERSGVKLKASQWLEVADQERKGIVLRLVAPFTLHGKEVIEIPKGAEGLRRPLIALQPVPVDSLFGGMPPGSPSAWPDAQGNFTLTNVYSGLYQIVPLGPPDGYYLAAVRLGESEPSTAEVEIDSGAAPLTVVYETGGGTIRGTVENCASGEVTAVPHDPAYQRPGFLYSVECDAQDRFQIGPMRPGDYDLLAFTGTPFDPWSPRLFRNQFAVPAAYANLVTAVTVRAGESTSAGLHAIARPGN